MLMYASLASLACLGSWNANTALRVCVGPTRHLGLHGVAMELCLYIYSYIYPEVTGSIVWRRVKRYRFGPNILRYIVRFQTL